MKSKKTGKKRLIAFGVIVLLIILYTIKWPIDRTSVIGRASFYLDEYQGYYLMTRDKKAFLQLGDGTAWFTVIYFLPGQREKMLDEIKKDVKDAFETLIEEHDDVFFQYEMSDDLKQIYIYEAPCGIGMSEFANQNPE